MDAALVIGIASAGSAIAVAWYARQHLRSARDAEARARAADIVVEQVGAVGNDEATELRLSVVNAGSAIARHVSLELVEWNDGRPLGLVLDHIAVAAALTPGHARKVELRLPTEVGPSTSSAIELEAQWLDDLGVHNKRVGIVLHDSVLELI